jgi:hypothetical protein
VRLLAWLIKANGIVMSLAFGLIELLLKAIAVTKRFSKKHEGTWSIAKSTKKIQQLIFSLSSEPLMVNEF